MKRQKLKEFEKLLKIMRKLYGKNGCPWDRKQTHKTLLKYIKEEVKEFEKAIKKKDFENMKEELGDILLHVVFHSEIARKNKKFDIFDVIENLNKKLIRRHPHVFGKKKIKNVKEVLRNWEIIKKKEKEEKCQQKTSQD